jgi:hypothetical protein
MKSDILPVKLEKFRAQRKKERTFDNRIDQEAFVTDENIEPMPYETKKIFLRIAEDGAKPVSQFLSLADCQKIWASQYLSSLFLLHIAWWQVTDFVKILLPNK